MPEVHRDNKKAYWLMHEGSLAFAELERNGMRVDVPYLNKTIKTTQKRILKLEKKLKSDKIWRKYWKRRFGDKAKLGSHPQLAQVLYGDLGYEVKAVTAKLQASTSKNSLAHIDLPFIKDYQLMGRLDKMLKTNLMGIKRELDSEGILRPTLWMDVARTIRSSCREPNGQNFPKRDEEIARIVRTAFIPRKGNHIIENDFKGIEVGSAASITKDKNLIKYVTDKSTDMHRDTAMDLFFMTKEEVIKDKKNSRDWSKNRFVFPQFYGSVYFQCAPSLWDAIEKGHAADKKIPGSDETHQERLYRNGIKKLGKCEPGEDPKPGTFEYHCQHAEQIMWKKRFKEYDAWKKKVYNDFLECGWFDIVTGFRFANPHSRNQVINYKIQGPAFHLNLTTIIFLLRKLKKYKMKSMMVMQIHDSEISDVPAKEVDDFFDLTKETVEKDVPKFWPWVNVPLEIEASVSAVNGNWYNTEEVKL